jgi:hypothetical protein
MDVSRTEICLDTSILVTTNINYKWEGVLKKFLIISKVFSLSAVDTKK